MIYKPASKNICCFICLLVISATMLAPGIARSQDPKETYQDLNYTDRMMLLKLETLQPHEIAEFFERLSHSEKKTLIENINDTQKLKLYNSLNDADKKIMLESLSAEEQQQSLQKFPGPAMLGETEKPLRPPIEEKESPPSRIEKIMSGMFPTDIAKELRLYGYDFFKSDTVTFAPMQNVPVGADYIIGPDDNFTIDLWGKTEKTYSVTVNRDGLIIIPRLGAVSVSGLSFAEMKNHLAHRFKEYYPDFEINITMGQLRTFQIFIVGEARRPGTYSVSSLSTLITALFASGGPGKKGSMRSIKLIRSTKTIKKIDLYDFFLKGDKKQDVRLEPGDTLFIPVIGSVVGIAGNVRRPAIYEMHANQTIADIIGLAGGVLPFGYLQNIVVERVEAHKRRIVRNFNVDIATKEAVELNSALQDGDLIKIYPVHAKIRDVVYLEGHVKYPRQYEFKPGMHISDLIPSYDYLLPEPFLQQAEIIRLVPPDLHPEIVGFNLEKLLEGDQGQDLLLTDLDRVKIYGKIEKKKLPEVTIKGAVRSPGTYRLFKGMTIKDLIFQADNMTDQAFQESGGLSRLVPHETGTDIIKITFSPADAMAGLSTANIALEPDDVVHIREIPQYSQALNRKVYLEGEFMFPGEFTFSENDLLSSVIERAGGLTKEAYPFGAVFHRDSAKKIQRERMKEYANRLEEDIYTLSSQAASTAIDKEEAAIITQTLAAKKNLLDKMRSAQPTGRMVINLEDVLANPSSSHNFGLRAGDRLIVNKRPDFVNVMGEVFNPTALFAEKDKSVQYYLNLVGGATNNAEDDQIYLVKANGMVISKSQEKFSVWPVGIPRITAGLSAGLNPKKSTPAILLLFPKNCKNIHG